MRTSKLLAIGAVISLVIACSGAVSSTVGSAGMTSVGGAGGATATASSGGVANAADGGGSQGATGNVQCSGDADCRLFDDYCGGCTCRALPKNVSDPVCNGTPFSCFVEPCLSNRATCVAGQCMAGGAGAGGAGS